MKNISKHINITEGGNWSSENRTTNINSVCGIINRAFEDNLQDPGTQSWVTQFESLLMQSKTEQSLFDFKQGFLRLDSRGGFDEDSFSKMIKTLTAMANTSSKSVGYVCVGVCDKKTTYEKVKELHGIDAQIYRDYYITGVSHEISDLEITSDVFFQQLIQKIENQPIKPEVISNICRNTNIISYNEKDIVVLKIKSMSTPLSYNGQFYTRHGANTVLIGPDEYPEFFTNYSDA